LAHESPAMGGKLNEWLILDGRGIAMVFVLDCISLRFSFLVLLGIENDPLRSDAFCEAQNGVEKARPGKERPEEARQKARPPFFLAKNPYHFGFGAQFSQHR